MLSASKYTDRFCCLWRVESYLRLHGFSKKWKISTESGWFWKRPSRNKFPNNRFLKSSQKQPCFNSDVFQSVLKNFVRVKHLFWSLFLIKLTKRLQHRRFPVNIANFLRTAFFIEHLKVVVFVSLIK